ncbi:MAG: AAA family ATPase [Candidatus Dependentiae bacterium]|nr:AAA family ATPase [Candidatus Dependentiae bacterium]
MMKNSFFKIFFFLTFFCCDGYVFSQKQNSKKPEKVDFVIKAGLIDISKKNIELFLQNHSLLCTTIMASSLAACLYPDKIKALMTEIKAHRDEVFVGSVATLAIMYYNKQQILDYVCQPDFDDEIEEVESSYSDNYAAFSESSCRIYHPGEILTKFKDVAGLETAKEDMSDILMFLKNQKKFTDIGAYVPKGVLMSGAPGNGKTLLARALAGEAQCPFLYINASEFIEAIVGVGAARIRHLFAIAKEFAPCIIFIDEIDAIGRKRSSHGSGGDTELAQSLNQLLAEMDGFEQQENPIIVIGATNRVDVLDCALLRPGRFDRKVIIHAPYVQDRCKILKVYLKKIKASKDIDAYKIATGTPGFSGAELKQLVNEAAILAIREGKTIVTMDHFDQARDYMLLGRETKGMEISKKELWQTAVHEAGHALACVFQKNAMPLYKVTITPRGPALGLTFSMDKESYHHSESDIRAEIIVLLGGSVAEEIMYAGRGAGACSDLQKARELATNMVMRYGMTQEFKDVTFAEFIHDQVHLPDEISTKLHKEVAKIIDECRAVAWQIVTDHKVQLEKLVEMLLESGTVFGRDVYELCEVAQPDISYSLSE